jgi:hypothetical protein
MSANLYETRRQGEYYHIHGSLEASTTLRMIGLAPFRPDLKTHEEIVGAIEGAVRQFTTEELEEMNAANNQAGVPVLKHEDFLKTSHVSLLSIVESDFVLTTSLGKDRFESFAMGCKPIGRKNTALPPPFQ